MTNREIINNIRNYFSGGPISNSFSLSAREVLFYLEKSRAKILYDDILAKRVISNHNKQTICVPLEEVEENYCDCSGQELKSCFVLRSKCPIPKLINNMVFAVDSVNGKLQHELVYANQVKYKMESRIKANATKTYVFFKTMSDGTYLYLINNEFIERVTFEALFEEPREADNFICCEDFKHICNPLDEKFYIDDRLVPLVQEMTIKFITGSRNIANDMINNDTDDKNIARR